VTHIVPLTLGRFGSKERAHADEKSDLQGCRMRNRIDPKQFRLYSNYPTIPLYRPDAVREIRDKKTGATKQVRVGKRPLDKNWTTKQYNQRPGQVVDRCISDQRNMGVRLRPTDMVMDVDPRNGGDKGLADLVLELGLDLKKYPRVITGSGGSHYYGTKPAKLLVVDTLKGYPGVEFKSKGRQVVAAGSVHPDTGKLYSFDPTNPPLDEAPPWPEELLKLIQRPQRALSVGGGQYSQEQLAIALDALDPEDYQDHDSWLALMMAAHHATGGDGRSEFIEWSISDPKYASDAEIIGRRWDSLHAERGDGYTYKTLNAALAEAGQSNLIVASAEDAMSDFDDGVELGSDDFEADVKKKKAKKTKSKAADEFESDDQTEFDFDPPEDGPDKEQQLTWLQELNVEYSAGMDGSKFRILKCIHDKALKRDTWLRIQSSDFERMYATRRVMSDHTGKQTPLGKAWIDWNGRRTFDQVIFDPTGNEHEGCLNLYRGWAMEPDRTGDWSYLQEMIFEVLCGGKQAYYDYVMNWAAFMFRYPDRPAETAVVFKGTEGVGKGTWGNSLVRIAGQHGMAIHSPDLLVGRFNSHMQDLIFLFADEAVKPYDKVAESKMKALITERMLTIEGKGRDAVTAPNYIHILMASNAEWVIPASMDARRYFVLEANTKWQRQVDKWNKLYDQLRMAGDSGYARLLHDLLKWKLPEGWHPARNMPNTDALTEQKLQSMSPLQHFFFDALLEGALPFPFSGDWEKEEVWFFRQDYRTAFDMYCKNMDYRYQRPERGSAFFIVKEFSELFPGAQTELIRTIPDDRADVIAKSEGRARVLTLPPLRDCRVSFENRLHGKINWGSLGAKKEEWER